MNTLVTPVIMLLIRLRIVRKQATCLRPPCQTARLTFVVLPFINRMSMSTCRTFFLSVPRGPVTVIRRDLMITSIPSGISSSSVLRTSRICQVKVVCELHVHPKCPSRIQHLHSTDFRENSVKFTIKCHKVFRTRSGQVGFSVHTLSDKFWGGGSGTGRFGN